MKLFTLPDHTGLIIAGVILLFVLVFRLAPLFFSRKKVSKDLPPGTPRDYGIRGGAICPKCHRPFSLGWMPINFGIGTKLARCEYCGKWSIVRRRSLEELRAAEAAELVESQPEKPIPTRSEEQKLKEEVDQSRFTDQT